MELRREFDVVIVGASIAGCTAAVLYGRAGARVALIERQRDIDAYKVACNHSIQRSARPTMDRLGVTSLIEEAGGVPNITDVWMRWGWATPPYNGHGFNIRRQTLDPIMRRMAGETQGVELILGNRAVEVLGDRRPAGLVIEDPSGNRTKVSARLVIGADGRASQVARLARVRGRVKRNDRLTYFGYYSNVKPADYPRSKFWLLDPDTASVFHNDNGITAIGIFVGKERLPEFRKDREGSFVRFIRSLPDAPPIDEATREGNLVGKLDMPNIIRPAAKPGLALVGDAALAADPLWGVGCGWAFQSAEWLVDATVQPLIDDSTRALDHGLVKYRNRHLRELGLHYLVIANYATGRNMNLFEQLLGAGAARDPKIAAIVDEVGSRCASPIYLLHSDGLPRATLTSGPHVVRTLCGDKLRAVRR